MGAAASNPLPMLLIIVFGSGPVSFRKPRVFRAGMLQAQKARVGLFQWAAAGALFPLLNNFSSLKALNPMPAIP